MYLIDTNSITKTWKLTRSAFVWLLAGSGLLVLLLLIAGLLSESREHWLESLLYAGSRLVGSWLGW